MKLDFRCGLDYEKMPVKGNGRFCSSCERVVVDFSKMSEEQIRQYFIGHSGEKICGRAKTWQTEERSAFISAILATKNYIEQRYRFIPLKLALLAMISGLLAFTSSCMGVYIPKEKPQPKPSKDSKEVKKK